MTDRRKETGLEFLARIDEQKESRARQQFSDEIERLKAAEEHRTTAPDPVKIVYMNPLGEEGTAVGE
jgi:hypothetical protein